jgi:hypothetical protein
MTNVAYAAALLAAVSVSPSGARQPSPSATWVWPLSPPVIARRFEPPPTPYAAGHRGVDIGGSAGQTVVAAGAGVVSFSGRVAGVGVVVIRHGTLRTTYEPVVPTVAAGARVTAGQAIGRLTAGHHGCDVCLHFGLRAGADYLDPVSLFARGPIRLLPVPADALAVVDAAAAGTLTSPPLREETVHPLVAAPAARRGGQAAVAAGAGAIVIPMAVRAGRRRRAAVAPDGAIA